MSTAQRIYKHTLRVVVFSRDPDYWPNLLKAGEAPYFIDRWADFSSTTVDPVNDADFWTVQTYAADSAQLGAPTRWAMWWGRVPGPRLRERSARH